MTDEPVEEEPDPRFTLANERTYLAWIRTALALIAAGVALSALSPDLPDGVRQATAVALVTLGVLSAISAHSRWFRVQHALRRARPLPTMRITLGLGYAIAVVGVVVVAFN